jgi:signal peptidase I
MNFFQRRSLKKKLRHFKHHVCHILHVDDDILNSAQKTGLQALAADVAAVRPVNVEDVKKVLDEGQQRLVKLIRHRKHSTITEYLDIIAVAVVVAFGIRGIFFQPFKIPTSSMQPTLYGIHYISSNDTIAKFPAILRYPLFSAVKTDPQGNHLNKGWYSQGDHLFVDRYSHHMTGLNRGDIVVFNTEGIVDPVRRNKLADKGYYYIKRLVGLPGDSLKIVDKKLYVKPAGENDFHPITDFSSKFDKLYSGKGGYQGHRSEDPFLIDNTVYQVPADSYFMMGDNTMFSYDSRFWGPVPRRNIVGRASVIFWPFSRRWGSVDRQPALDVPTGVPDLDSGRFSSMTLQ